MKCGKHTKPVAIAQENGCWCRIEWCDPWKVTGMTQCIESLYLFYCIPLMLEFMSCF